MIYWELSGDGGDDGDGGGGGGAHHFVEGKS